MKMSPFEELKELQMISLNTLNPQTYIQRAGVIDVGKVLINTKKKYCNRIIGLTQIFTTVDPDIDEPRLIATLSFEQLVMNNNISSWMEKGCIEIKHSLVTINRLQAAIINPNPGLVVTTAIDICEFEDH